MVYYHYKRENVLINKKEYEAFFPRKHTTIQAIVYHTKDVPVGDHSIAQYTWLYIKPKDKNRWKKLYEGPTKQLKVPNIKEQGWQELNKVLFALETEEVRKTPTTRYLTRRDLVDRLSL